VTAPTINKTVEIADALTLELTEVFTGAQVKRIYAPTLDLDRLQTLSIFVTVKHELHEVEDRGDNRQTHQVDVGIYRKVDPGINAEVDALLLEVEKLKLLFADPDEAGAWDQQGRLRDKILAGAEWMKLTHELLYDPQALQDRRFQTVITLDYELTR